MTEDVPKGAVKVRNVISIHIIIRYTTLYRMADSLWGWAMDGDAREEMLLDMEQLREDYIDI